MEINTVGNSNKLGNNYQQKIEIKNGKKFSKPAESFFKRMFILGRKSLSLIR